MSVLEDVVIVVANPWTRAEADHDEDNGGENSEHQDSVMNDMGALAEELDHGSDEPERARNRHSGVHTTNMQKEGCDGVTEPEWGPAFEEV